MYPVTIVDNFFSNPDAIVEIAKEVEYNPSENGSWPGKRSAHIADIDSNLFRFIGDKIHSIFQPTTPLKWGMDMWFQRIDAYNEDQYHPTNRGWIHRDMHCNFGGIIYLNKTPDKDTGTSIYSEKFGYSYFPENEVTIKNNHYLGNQITESEFVSAWERNQSQFVETVTVENIYNRMLLFNPQTFHGVKTFGCKPRLTIAFFSKGELGNVYPPLYR